MLDTFTQETIETADTTIFIRRAGQGAPLLLLHGFPQTHVMWRGIAPRLAEKFSVVCADLRGYGRSGRPPSGERHRGYSKRVMAADMVDLMRRLGFEQFSVVGHDRGGRVAYRLALDHPQCLQRVAVLDVIPTLDFVVETDVRAALTFWPWSLLSQPEPLPEVLVHAHPQLIVDDALANWGSDPSCFSAEARVAYVDSLRDAASVHAICEEYRASLTCDIEADLADRRSDRRIAAPLLTLWSYGSGLDKWYESCGGPLQIWKRWAHDAQGHAISGGHFFPETNPEETMKDIDAFLVQS